ARVPTQWTHTMTPELLQYAVPSAVSFLGLIITAIAGPAVLGRLNRQDRELKVARDHAANTHTTHLRADPDRVGAKVDRLVDSLRVERAGRRSHTRGRRQAGRVIRAAIESRKEAANPLWGRPKQKVRGASVDWRTP